MTIEELKEHCKRQVQQFERVEKIKPVTLNDWKRYEEHKLILELLEQEPILDKARAEMFEEMQSHSGTGEEAIQAYADGIKKGLDILDKYKAEFEAKDKVSQG